MPQSENAERRKKIREAFLKSLENGANITNAAKAAGVSLFCIWKWRKDSKTFDKRVNAVLDSRIQVVEDALYQNAVKNNNTQAQIFFLKNRSGGRWRDRFGIDFEDNVKITVKVENGQ